MTAYRLLVLRAAVFVVEQHCAYLDPDGRDLEASAEQWWIEDGAEIAACLRVLDEGVSRDGVPVRRIGRVATAPGARGRGLASRLTEAVLAAYAPDEFVLSAQAHLVEWYAGFGFEAEGEAYLEDGIPHRAMRRKRSRGNVSAGTSADGELPRHRKDAMGESDADEFGEGGEPVLR